MIYRPLIPIRPANYPKGTVLQVDCYLKDFGFYRHVGITDGCGHVISNSKKERKVVCQTLSDFAGGKRMTINSSFQGDGVRAYKRAEARLGEPYDVVNNNCEHFIYSVYGKAKQSPQLRNAVTAVFVGFAFSLLFGNK